MTSRRAASTRSVPRRSGLRSKPSHRASLARLPSGLRSARLRITFTSRQASLCSSLPRPARPGQGRWALAPGSWSSVTRRGPSVPTSGTRRGDLLPCCRAQRATRLADGDMEEIAMTGTTYGIVAGYDGSPGAAQALRWAAREAWARGTDADGMPGLDAGSHGAAHRVGPVRPGQAARPGDPDPRAAVRRVGARPRPGPRGPGRRAGRPGAVRTQPGRRHGGGRQPRAR